MFFLRFFDMFSGDFRGNRSSLILLKARCQVWDNFGNRKRFKNDEKCFLFNLKAFFGLEIFKFLFWLFGYVEKWLDLKDEVNLKISNVTTC